MNAPTLTLASVALGVMIGITGTHFHQVHTMANSGLPQFQTSPNLEQNPSTPSDKVDTPSLAQEPVMLTSNSQGLPPQVSAMMQNQTDPKLLKAMMEMMAKFNDEQKRLSRQIAETNRDMHELSFEVDTHSNEFRPMRVDGSRPRTLGTRNMPSNGIDGDGIVPVKQ